jgi:hypothetical protein
MSYFPCSTTLGQVGINVSFNLVPGILHAYHRDPRQVHELSWTVLPESAVKASVDQVCPKSANISGE